MSNGGFFIPHSYADTVPDDLSWWVDVGFRRVMVWWQHPRYVYLNAIEERARVLAGEDPGGDLLIEGFTKNYRRVGRSRKKVVSYTSREPSKAQRQYYEHHRRVREQLVTEGIDSDAVRPTFKRERLWWATGIDLVAPLEVHNESELASVAALVKRLLLGDTTIEAEFSGYRYGRADWLAEQKKRSASGKIAVPT